MKGKILGFDKESNEGIIVGEDGNRYKFSTEEWKEGTAIYKGIEVDFDIQDSKVVDIYIATDSKSSQVAESVFTNAANRNMLDIFVDVLKNHYADFDGRTRRRTFWLFVLMNTLISFGLTMLASVGGDFGSIMLGIWFIYWLGTLVPITALITRRLHDIGKSGWWQLITLVPIIGPIVLLIWLVTKSDPLPNKYGDVPVDE